MSRWRGLVGRHSRGWGLLFAAYWFAMFLATHIELPEVASAPQNTDKVVHLVMYAGFAFLLSLWLSAKRTGSRVQVWIVLGSAVLYAGLDELLQSATKTRSADIWDFVMDLLGAIAGVLIFRVVRRKLPSLWEFERQGASRRS